MDSLVEEGWPDSSIGLEISVFGTDQCKFGEGHLLIHLTTHGREVRRYDGAGDVADQTQVDQFLVCTGHTRYRWSRRST